MKRFLYVLCAANVVWVLASLTGILVDSANLVVWTQHLMGSLLASVVLAPVLVFSHSSPASTGASPTRPVSENTVSASAASPATRPAPRPRRSGWRWVSYAITAGLVLTLFASLFGLFLDPERLPMWTNVLMGTLLASVVWAPILVFWSNPLEDPSVVSAPEPAPFVPEPAAPAVEPQAAAHASVDPQASPSSPASSSASAPSADASDDPERTLPRYPQPHSVSAPSRQADDDFPYWPDRNGREDWN